MLNNERNSQQILKLLNDAKNYEETFCFEHESSQWFRIIIWPWISTISLPRNDNFQIIVNKLLFIVNLFLYHFYFVTSPNFTWLQSYSNCKNVHRLHILFSICYFLSFRVSPCMIGGLAVNTASDWSASQRPQLRLVEINIGPFCQSVLTHWTIVHEFGIFAIETLLSTDSYQSDASSTVAQKIFMVQEILINHVSPTDEPTNI